APLALHLAHKAQPAPGAAAARAIARARRIDDVARQRSYGPRLFVDAPIAAQITRIVEHDLLLRDVRRQPRLNPRQEFAVVLDFERCAEVPPILADSAHAMRADRQHLLYVALPDVLDICLGELRKQQIVSEPAGRISVAALLPQHTEGHAQMPQNRYE